MSIHTDPSTEIPFTVREAQEAREATGGSVAIEARDALILSLRPLTLREEATLLDIMTSEGKLAKAALYVLERAWVGVVEGMDFQEGPHGGANEKTIRALSWEAKHSVRAFLIDQINLTEEETKK